LRALMLMATLPGRFTVTKCNNKLHKKGIRNLNPDAFCLYIEAIISFKVIYCAK
jgi:hypothetical protein